MGVDDDFLRLGVEQGPVTNGVAHHTLVVGGVLEHKGAEVGRLLGQLALRDVSVFAVEVPELPEFIEASV